MTSSLKRQENVARVAHTQVVQLWHRPDFKRLTDEQLTKPSLFAKLSDPESIAYVRGLLNASGRSELMPAGLRVSKTRNCDEVQVLLGSASGERFILVTSEESMGRLQHFKWEIFPYKDFTKEVPQAEPIQRIPPRSSGTYATKPKPDERITIIMTSMGAVQLHNEGAWIKFGAYTFFALRGEIEVTGKIAVFKTDLTREFFTAISEAKNKDPRITPLLREIMRIYDRLQSRETPKPQPESARPRERTKSTGFAAKGGCLFYKCKDNTECEFNYARGTISVGDRVMWDHRFIPVEFLQEILQNKVEIPGYVMSVFLTALKRTIRQDVKVAGADLIRWAIQHRVSQA